MSRNSTNLLCVNHDVGLSVQHPMENKQLPGRPLVVIVGSSYSR